ncbi:helix-turn-helix transcriptional regulator [Cellvibrio japonicus]|uniref:Putative two-component transcriptional regulator, LuxR family n=1 Tax=Cellvibrio japonicus (strain Ueda107) TaxID=498211 RepID=B3PCB5_CELJU|nr:LuxR family transcriptional regulator [Cellvibrio japonicus]ACE84000.1 putative two-component transcriptional regulator, LuxR family [Cellvibrio japonicus Ueda107]QEI11826.1 LuxR family transcriptional regulator [Cellvibrio japonicus]QEI15400.1 LuxR family transcriptional regulator [Cellvibrio japonicus]QEI18979.1 LuxR family transcriptional regulator [Cellvibrio japonicus]
MNMEDYICETNNSKNIQSLFNLFEKYMSDIGFDRVILGLMTDHPRLKKEAEHGFLKNYPADWVERYFDQKYVHIDPVRHKAYDAIGAYTWDELKASMQLSNKQIQMFNEAEDARLFNGVGVSMRGPGGAIAAVGAACSVKNGNLNKDILDAANLMSVQFYTCYWRLMEKKVTLVHLTAKEQEILTWSAAGYTKSQIAHKLCISVHTVDFHVRNCLAKLEAQNITHAVSRALNLSLIHM